MAYFLWECSKCHHEWEAQKAESCGWCGTEHPAMLQEINLDMFKSGPVVVVERFKT